jgi:hypothetical protein
MKKSVVVSLLLAAACGDNIAPLAGDPDAAPDPGPDAAVTAKAIITAGDFNVTGTIATIALPSRTVTANAVAGVAQGDPIIRRFGSEVVIVNRQGGDNVTVLDAATLQLVGEQMATGAGSNPQDVAAVGRKLYLPALGTTGVVVLNRDQPSARTTIDLSALDADGRPECNSAYAIDNRVYVVCGILDGFAVRGNGRVAVIDAATDTVVDDFDLGIQNPNGQVQRTPEGSVFGGDLLIPAVPSYSDFSRGCLAVIPSESPSAPTAPRSGSTSPATRRRPSPIRSAASSPSTSRPDSSAHRSRPPSASSATSPPARAAGWWPPT